MIQFAPGLPIRIRMLPSAPGLSRTADFRDLPLWLWLWFPLTFYLFSYLAGFVLDHDTYRHFFIGEMSVPDLSTFLILLPAIVFGILAARHAWALKSHFLVGWPVLGTLGCLYFAGEESSWGQWYLRWDTPEAWAALNDQQETNLHNMAGFGFLLDQLPRALLTLGAFIGGIVVPLYLKLRGRSLDPARLWYWIWPTIITLPAAVFGAFLARIDRTIGGLVGHDWPFYDLRTGELKEFMLAYFLLMYLASMALRLRQLRNAVHS